MDNDYTQLPRITELKSWKQRAHAMALRARSEEERLADLTDEQFLAELLHERLCHAEHTESCGWYYLDWQEPHNAREVWLDKARALNEETKKLLVKMFR